jgi:hypothetical protein
MIGGNEMKINPKKAALIGLAATTLFSASGCSMSKNADVYGPPDMMESDDPIDTEVPKATITPEENKQETVYGPSEMFEEQKPTLDPADNETVDVYGPPEMFE